MKLATNPKLKGIEGKDNPLRKGYGGAEKEEEETEKVKWEQGEKKIMKAKLNLQRHRNGDGGMVFFYAC